MLLINASLKTIDTRSTTEAYGENIFVIDDDDDDDELRNFRWSSARLDYILELQKKKNIMKEESGRKIGTETIRGIFLLNY